MANQRAVLQYAAELLKGTLATEHSGGPATCVRIGSADVHVSLTDDSPPVMQAISHVLRGVDASAELFAALNHISANTPFVRVFHRERDVLVMGDLLLDHLSDVAITTLATSVSEVADFYDDQLQERFGGLRASDDPNGCPLCSTA